MSPRLLDKAADLARRVPRIVYLVAAGVLGVAAIAIVAALVLTARPAFLGGYHVLERNYETLQTSAHSGIACDGCHVDARGELTYRAALLGDFFRGLYKRPSEPVFVELTTPTSAACLTCHREDWSDDASRTATIPHPAHLRVAAETRDCVECHKWTAHEEEYVERHKEMPFSTVCASFGCHVGTKTTEDCRTCHHQLQAEDGEWAVVHKDTVRTAGPNACLEACHEADQCQLCHTTGKRPELPAVLPSAAVQVIEREHVKSDWMEKHGAVALKDDSQCFVCHVSSGECQDCHSIRPDFHGPESTWLHQHADVAKDERRCLACHEKPWCDECHAQFKETQ